MILLEPSLPFSEEREITGTATAPTTTSPKSPTMDGFPPTCHHQGCPNKKNSLFQTTSNTIVRRLWIWISSLVASLTHLTASPKPLRSSSLKTGIGGAHSSNIKASQTNSWGGFYKSRWKSSYHHLPLQYKETSLAQPGKNTTPHNCQVRHTGCIYLLPDAPLERSDLRVLRSNIFTLIETTKGLTNAGPNNKKSKS